MGGDGERMEGVRDGGRRLGRRGWGERWWRQRLEMAESILGEMRTIDFGEIGRASGRERV